MNIHRLPSRQAQAVKRAASIKPAQMPDPPEGFEELYAKLTLKDAEGMRALHRADGLNNGLSERVRCALTRPMTTKQLADELDDDTDNVRGRLNYLKKHGQVKSEWVGNTLFWSRNDP